MLILLLGLLLFSSLPVLPQASITNSVVVGGVTSQSARFWVRTSEPAAVHIELSSVPEFTETFTTGQLLTTELSNNTAILSIGGLQPLTKYHYRVLINNLITDEDSRSFTTFPGQGTPSEFNFAFGSCQQNGASLSSPTPPGTVYREIVKHNPSFFLQIGDWGYPDSTDNLPSDNDVFSADYRRVQDSYVRKYVKDFPMDSLMRLVPVDYVYDDHDYMNNNASALTSSFFLPYRPNPFSDDFVVNEIPSPSEARINSIRGYIENFPGYTPDNSSRGIYHKFTYGNADFFVLDLRSQRSPNLDGFSKDESTGDWSFTPPQGHSILGRDDAPGEGQSQYDWFLNALLNSTADWKFVVSSIPFNKAQKQALDLGIALQDAIVNYPDPSLPEGVSVIGASMELADKWVAFPEDINGVLNFIDENNIKNVIVLSGDSHTAALDDGANAGLPEIMAGGLDITNSKTVALFEMFGLHIWNKGGQGISTDQFNNAFGKVTVSGRDSVTLELIDEFGTRFAYHTIKNTPTSVSYNTRPQSYQLEQNYPNPFNPVTKIVYRVPSLPAGEIVTIKVYDILGNEAAVLVNEYKPSGKHDAEFNAAGFPSGVYFYRMTAGSYTETRKMIVLK